MLKFNAERFSWLCFHQERLQGEAVFDLDAPDAAEQIANWKKNVQAHLRFMAEACESIGLDASAAQCRRVGEWAKGPITMEPLCYLLEDVEDTITTELRKPLFLILRADLATFYEEEDTSVFGADVARHFEAATHDVAEARRCFALERWDASVHHLMLAIEQAIRKWAQDLRLRTRLPYDLENIEQILQAADAKQKEIKNRKKSRKRDLDLKYVAETSGHFGFIKDAWRNHAAHGRERYDERKAKNLAVHVEAFMRLLATRKKLIT